MQRNRPFMQLFILPALIVLVGVSGCSASEESSTSATTGGSGITGSGGSGATSPGDTSSTGGANVGNGGAPATGGATFGRGGTTTGQGGRATGGRAAIGGASSANAPTWNQLWTNYFQPQCASCHANSSDVGNSRVFNNAAQLCTFLRNDGQLNGTTTPALINANQSVLTWFSNNGSMPEGNMATPANAVNDIRAWAAAGAVCP